MEANEETYRLFDNYLSGNLSGQEKVVFEKMLSENDSLRDEFIWMSSAVNSIRMSGNQIFKKQMAEIGMGIPASAFAKYSPSIKPKNFFRKYWWAIAAASAIVIAVACWFIFVHHQHSPESEMDVAPALMDSAKKQDSVPAADSCVDSPVGTKPQYTQAMLDSLNKDSNSEIIFGGDAGDPETCNTFGMSVFSYSGNRLYEWVANVPQPKSTDKNYNDVSGDTTSLTDNSYRFSVAEKISVTFCRISSTPSYAYASDIRIYGPYADSTNITLIKREENEIIMTDGKPGYFILTKGVGAKNLVRQYEWRNSVSDHVDTVGKPNGKMVKPANKTPKKK